MARPNTSLSSGLVGDVSASTGATASVTPTKTKMLKTLTNHEQESIKTRLPAGTSGGAGSQRPVKPPPRQTYLGFIQTSPVGSAKAAPAGAIGFVDPGAAFAAAKTSTAPQAGAVPASPFYTPRGMVPPAAVASGGPVGTHEGWRRLLVRLNRRVACPGREAPAGTRADAPQLPTAAWLGPPASGTGQVGDVSASTGADASAGTRAGAPASGSANSSTVWFSKKQQYDKHNKGPFYFSRTP